MVITPPDMEDVIEPQPPFKPRDTLANTFDTFWKTGAAGLTLAAVQNAMSRQNYGMMGVFTKYGGTTALFAGMGATFRFTVDSAANLRGTDDTLNYALAGAVAGALPGLPRRSFPLMVGSGAALAVTMATANYVGGVWPKRPQTEEDEFERKERMKKLRRRPIEETVAQLGEGRGIRDIGWEDRRAERLREKYGVDVKATPPTKYVP